MMSIRWSVLKVCCFAFKEIFFLLICFIFADDKLIAVGNSQISIFDYNSGNLLNCVDFKIDIGCYLTSYCCSSEVSYFLNYMGFFVLLRVGKTKKIGDMRYRRPT